MRGLTVDTSPKRPYSEYYYRNALEKETDKFLKKTISTSKRHFLNLEKEKNNRGFEDIIKAFVSLYVVNYGIYIKNSEKIVNKFLNIAQKDSAVAFKRAMKKITKENLSFNLNAPIFKDVLKLKIRQNVSLIKTISTQSFSNIETIVYDAVTKGQGWGEIEESLFHQYHISTEKIKKIARDQAAKTTQSLNELSQRQSGIEYFEWQTMEDERVSEGFGGHEKLNGKIYKWGDTENYPIIDSYGNRGVPSERVNCRCIALAVILRENEVLIKQSDGSYKREIKRNAKV
ncbi:MAG: phage minor head protein [Alphaproteobacteria bacterium]